MIGTSTPEYVFIRASIVAIRVVTPLSILYCGFCILNPPRTLLSKLALSYATIETVFYCLVYLPRRWFLQTAARHPRLIDRSQRRSLFQRCCETIPNPEYYLSKWFLDSPKQEIKRDNVKEFFRWSFLNTGEVDEADEEELEEYVDEVETLLERPLEPGRGRAKCLRLTIDKVDMIHRPLIWYIVVGIVDTGIAAFFRFYGFQFHRTPFKNWFSVFPFRICNFFTTRTSSSPQISYWYRPHTSKTRLPVLFIHGIGIGLYPYAKFLAEINESDELKDSDGDVGIIALEIMPVSFRITGPVLGRGEMVEQIDAILEAHGWNNLVLVSHSYGTVISTHLLQTPGMAEKIGPAVLIDPVTFLLHLPDVAYNFTARKPHGANEHQLYFFASKDMMVAHSLHRQFFWSENILWKEDVTGRNVTVSLGGRDLIVDTETVGKYLVGQQLDSEDGSWKEEPWIGEGLDVLFFPSCDHAQVFEHKITRRRLVQVVSEYCGGR